MSKEWFVLGGDHSCTWLRDRPGYLHMTLCRTPGLRCIVARLGLGFLKISEDVKSGVMAIVVALLLIWRLDASSLLIVALVALNFFTGRAKRKSRP